MGNDQTLLYKDPSQPSAPARLVITTPDGRTIESALTGDELTLGRLDQNNIVVNIPAISRRHLRLRRQGNDYLLTVEPNVSNPVFVNGEQVQGPRLLKDGDKLSLGYIGDAMSVSAVYHAAKTAPPPARVVAPEPMAGADPQATRIEKAPASFSQPPKDPDITTVEPRPSLSSQPPPSPTPRDSGATMIGRLDSIQPSPAKRDPYATVIGQVPSGPTTPPQLVVTASGKAPTIHTLTTDRIRIGRNPDNDIVLDNRFVSRYHAEIERRAGAYYVIPAPTVGNPLVLDGAPVMEPTRLQHGAKLRIGGFEPGEMITIVYLSPDESSVAQGGQQTIEFSESKVLSIGRDKANDIVLNAPTISRVHAQVERIGQRYRVKDLGSGNGTFVNGQALRGETWVSPGDTLHIGPYRLQVGAEKITQLDETAGGVSVDAHELNKRVRKDLNLLQNISLAFQPREFIVVVGQSGGGKSTLLDAISGYRPATQGRVMVNDTIDVYKNFDTIRNNIGYVPQRDIIHMELTVFQALDYAAQLRMPADTTPQERHQRIDEVLEELDLSHRKDTQISELSGGQQKRVSIGVELLNKPGLFFLDEPTSGLDPGTETELMHLMRRLADQGRTVVLITHATKNVMLADRVVFLARGGYLAWFGPPEEALTYFDQYRSERERRTKPMEFDDIYSLLDRAEQGSAKDWAERYQKSEAYQKYIVRPLAQKAPAPTATTTKRSAPQPVSALRQFFILSARNIKILTRDRATLGLMLLAAPLMAALDFVLAFGVGRNPFGFKGGDFNDILVSLIVLSNNGILVGAISMARELVKEREIYKRERMVNLHLAPYIFSKLWFALLLGLYMGVCFTVIRYLAFDMPGTTAEFFYFLLTVFLMILAGMMIGLFTSALAPNQNSAQIIMVLFILPQIVLSGALVPLPEFVSGLASSHWAFQAAMAISGAGSDPARDTCWTDLTADERKDMSLDEKNEKCNCMGVNALRQESCNFPGIGDFYDEAIDVEDPVKPEDPGDQPAQPDLPPAPEAPENLQEPGALQAYFAALDNYNEEADRKNTDFKNKLSDYQDKVDDYKIDIEDYQDEVTELETDRATAVGSAESLIKRFWDDYGWTFVNQEDREVYMGVLIKTWIAQSMLILALFIGTIVAQRRWDVR